MINPKHYRKKKKNEFGLSSDTEDESDYVEKEEDDGTGGKVKVRYFKDGTSEVHWGGPGGIQYCDEFGNS